jgi:hypothetical protein
MHDIALHRSEVQSIVQEVFCTPIEVEFLQQTLRGAAELICVVFNSVTAMGWQFPGTSGPGAIVYETTSTSYL